MHPLLKRQLKKTLKNVAVDDGPWPEFLATVNAAYKQADQEREFVERTLNVVSEELTAANDQIRRDAENQLARLTDYYSRTLDTQKGLVLCYRRLPDGDFEHTLCRGQLSQRMGYPPERVEHHRLGKILRGPLLRRMQRIYQAGWVGKLKTLEGGSKRRGIRFLAVFHPLKENGVTTEVIVSAVEITDLKDTERALRQAKAKAEAADRAKSDFLAVMSHEIRTPMNSVIGFTSLLRTTELTAEQEHFVKMIESSGEGLLEIINDVLDISKIEAGRLELSVEPVEPVVLAHEIVAMMQSRTDEKGIKLRFNVAPGVPDQVNTDRARLRQILINLMGNAIKFTAEGSVSLDIEYGAANMLSFKVTDTGIGIPPEGIERLFKPFSQVDSSTTRNFGGTGLGLAICKRLSEAMGGGIEVTSEAGQGSCFSFTVSAPEVTEALAPLAEGDLPPDAQFLKDTDDNPSLLVVDDNPINRKVLGMILKVGGYGKVDFAENGAQAVNHVRDHATDIVFMDVEMPVMDGMTASREIRALARTTDQMPWIIGLSANVWRDTVERALASGMNDYLSKPVKREDVGASIRKRSRP